MPEAPPRQNVARPRVPWARMGLYGNLFGSVPGCDREWVARRARRPGSGQAEAG